MGRLALNQVGGPLPTAVDGNVLGIEEFSITQTDSRNHLCYVGGSTPSVQKGLFVGSLGPGIRGGLSPLGLNPTWVDAIDSQFGGMAFGQAFREGADGGFDRTEKLSAVPLHALGRLVPTYMDHRWKQSMRGGLADLALGNMAAQEHHGADIQVPQFGKFFLERPRLGLSC